MWSPVLFQHQNRERGGERIDEGKKRLSSLKVCLWGSLRLGGKEKLCNIEKTDQKHLFPLGFEDTQKRKLEITIMECICIIYLPQNWK